MKISSKIAFITFCLALLNATPALSTPYVSGEIGFFGVEVTSNTPFSYSEDNYLGAVGRIGLGNLWPVNDCLQVGLEAGGNIFGSHGDSYFNGSMDYDRYSFDLLAVADQHITRRFNIFAKAGVAYAKDEVSFSDYNFYQSTSSSGVVPKGVLGIGYDLTKRINVNLAYNKEFNANNVDAISFLTAGLKVNF